MTTASLHIADPKRLAELLEETEDGLLEIQPKIEKLEKQLEELKELKLSKQRLLTLKMSLKAMMESMTLDNVMNEKQSFEPVGISAIEAKLYDFTELSTLKTFSPQHAFLSVDKILKQKQSLNYDIFKAVVFKGGKATTEEIKAFLVESGAKQPQTGKGFEDVPLTEISSRANYLVRKGVLQPAERGTFYSPLGWIDPIEG